MNVWRVPDADARIMNDLDLKEAVNNIIHKVRKGTHADKYEKLSATNHYKIIALARYEYVPCSDSSTLSIILVLALRSHSDNVDSH